MLKDNSFYTRKDLYLMEHTTKGKSLRLAHIPLKKRRKTTYENMNLMSDMTFTPGLHYPQILPYTGSTDFILIPYGDRNKHDGKNEALHFFLDDYRFRNAVWYNLDYTTYCIGKYDYVFTPDLSLWKDLPTDFYNRENVFRTRFIGAYWQKCGYNVIPTASWGDLSSFSYCFEGLPTNSVIAVSGMGNRRSDDAFNRWCYGLRRLEEAVSPTLIIIYGEEVEVQGIHTPLMFIPCFIQQRLRSI